MSPLTIQYQQPLGICHNIKIVSIKSFQCTIIFSTLKVICEENIVGVFVKTLGYFSAMVFHHNMNVRMKRACRLKSTPNPSGMIGFTTSSSNPVFGGRYRLEVTWTFCLMTLFFCHLSSLCSLCFL